MVHRAGTFSQIQHSRQSTGDVFFGLLYRLRQGIALGQIGRDRTGESAAGSMSVGIIDALPIKPLKFPIRVQKIVRIVDIVSALD